MSALLDVEHLSMRFGGLTAISDLTFRVEENEIAAIIGPNGAGKTTVFNCLTGFYRPPVGRMQLFHKDGTRFLLERIEAFRIAREAKVVRTFQNVRLFANMSALENLVIAQHEEEKPVDVVLGLFASKSMRAQIERARYWLEKVGLLPMANERSGALPYGSQRKLEIARAMCASPVLLCLDEPAAGLNARESEALNALLLDIRREHKLAILIIEHDMSVVMRISDHVVVLDHGACIAQGAPEQVRADPAVIRAYLGAPETEAVGSLVC